MIQNIHIEINDLHVSFTALVDKCPTRRFDDDDCTKMTMGISMAELLIKSADQRGRNFFNNSTTDVFKVVEVKQLAVYVLEHKPELVQNANPFTPFAAPIDLSSTLALPPAPSALAPAGAAAAAAAPLIQTAQKLRPSDFTLAPFNLSCKLHLNSAGAQQTPPGPIYTCQVV